MPVDRMNGRAFIAGLGSAAAWPLVARGQPGERMRRRIGMLMNVGADDPDGRERVATFIQKLQRLNWTDGRNVQIDFRWAAGDAEQFRKDAQDLVALEPEVLLAAITPAVVPYGKQPVLYRLCSLRSSTRWVPAWSRA